MKKSCHFLFLILSVFVFISCNSDQKKTEKLVEAYLKEHLKDPTSYESISFGEIDSTSSKHTDEQIFKDILLEFDILATEGKLAVHEKFAAQNDEEKAKIEAKEDSLSKKLGEVAEAGKNFRENYKPYFNGYKITHKYRAKNGFGAFDIYEQEFYTNKDITEILETKKVE